MSKFESSAQSRRQRAHALAQDCTVPSRPRFWELPDFGLYTGKTTRFFYNRMIGDKGSRTRERTIFRKDVGGRWVVWHEDLARDFPRLAEQMVWAYLQRTMGTVRLPMARVENDCYPAE